MDFIRAGAGTGGENRLHTCSITRYNQHMRLLAVLCAVFLLFSCSSSKKQEVSKEQEASKEGGQTQEETSKPSKNFSYAETVKTTGVPILGIYTVDASSWLSGEYDRTHLIDGSWKAWATKGSGKGEMFTFNLNISPSTIAGFAIKNGHGDPEQYEQYNRIKRLVISTNSGWHHEVIEIKDSMNFEQYALERPVIYRGGVVEFRITDIYPGTSHDNTCVAEIVLLERIANDDEFSENILSWLEHGKEIASVSDADKIRLLDYLPFDIIIIDMEGYTFKNESKIQRLNGQAALRLNNNLPRLDGATAMYPLYSAFVHAVYPQKALDVELEEGTNMFYYDSNNNTEIYKNFHTTLLNWDYFPSFDLIKEIFRSREFKNEEKNSFASIVQCNTTPIAYQRLINGETDMIFCYAPSQAQIDAAAAKGKRFNMTPIAKDAFVFIVNDKNMLNNITVQQIRDIYSGRVTNWKDITGINQPIIAYQRTENSGSQSTLQSIMGEDSLIQPIMGSEYIPLGGMSEMVREIVSDYYNYNAAIGYTFLFYLNKMAGSTGTKVLSIDGVAPNSQNVQNGTYPFSQTVYAVTTGNESENTRRFIEWILSAQGQELVKITGYTPVR
jgi:phosphate transport system substrate-binding protein